MDEMKRELTSLKAEVLSVKKDLAASTIRLEGRIDALRAEMATKTDIDRIISHIVAFTRDVEAARRDRVLYSDAYMRHQDRLDDHEARLARLEEKKP